MLGKFKFADKMITVDKGTRFYALEIQVWWYKL